MDTNCRAGLIEPASGATLSLVLDSGTLFGDQNQETMFTAFSVSDSMTSDAVSRAVYAVGAPVQPLVNGPINLVPIISPTVSGVFDGPSATYTCTTTGPYFFSASVGVPANTQTRVQITNDVLPVELTRNSLNYNGVTTLSRSTILQCNAGQKVELNLLTGMVVQSGTAGFQYNLTSFTAFPYLPRNVSQPVAWAAYKDYIVESIGGPTDPLYFTNVTVNIGNAYSEQSNTVIAPVAGYYYMNLNVGAGINKTLELTLQRQNEVFFAIDHTTTNLNAEDSYSHSVIVLLAAGDVVRAVALTDSTIFSGVVGYQTAFVGMLLYGV